jgi:hypothetical protein
MKRRVSDPLCKQKDMVEWNSYEIHPHCYRIGRIGNSWSDGLLLLFEVLRAQGLPGDQESLPAELLLLLRFDGCLHEESTCPAVSPAVACWRHVRIFVANSS